MNMPSIDTFWPPMNIPLLITLLFGEIGIRGRPHWGPSYETPTDCSITPLFATTESGKAIPSCFPAGKANNTIVNGGTAAIIGPPNDLMTNLNNHLLYGTALCSEFKTSTRVYSNVSGLEKNRKKDLDIGLPPYHTNDALEIEPQEFTNEEGRLFLLEAEAMAIEIRLGAAGDSYNGLQVPLMPKQHNAAALVRGDQFFTACKPATVNTAHETFQSVPLLWSDPPKANYTAAAILTCGIATKVAIIAAHFIQGTTLLSNTSLETIHHAETPLVSEKRGYAGSWGNQHTPPPSYHCPAPHLCGRNRSKPNLVLVQPQTCALEKSSSRIEAKRHVNVSIPFTSVPPLPGDNPPDHLTWDTTNAIAFAITSLAKIMCPSKPWCHQLANTPTHEPLTKHATPGYGYPFKGMKPQYIECRNGRWGSGAGLVGFGWGLCSSGKKGFWKSIIGSGAGVRGIGCIAQLQ